MVVELKSGRTPREVTAQALDYSSWVKDLGFDEVVSVADRFLAAPAPSQRHSGRGLRRNCPSNSTRATARWWSPIPWTPAPCASSVTWRNWVSPSTWPRCSNSGTPAAGNCWPRSFSSNLRRFVPEFGVRPPGRRTGRSTSSRSLADENGIGEVYRRLRDGVRGIFTANGYSRTVGYVRRLENGGVRTLMLVGVVPGDEAHGMKFTVHGDPVRASTWGWAWKTCGR